jgi:perosamine synthetase
MISLFNTYIHPDAKKEVLNVIESTFLSEGQTVKKFEKDLVDKLGVLPCLTVNSGTSALHLALEVAGVGKDDEVIIPAQTFIATGLTVLQCGAKPVFADINYEDGNINIDSVKQKISKKTKAIIPVHWGGNPCDMDELTALCSKQGIVVIEDAAHAIGAEYKGKPVGAISDMTCFSFQAIKHLTTGDGGAITFRSDKHFQQAYERRWFGINREKDLPNELGERQHDLQVVGYKYHMNNYAAALGIANLSDLQERITNRRMIAAHYKEALKNVAGITLFREQEDRKSAYWLFGFHVENRLNFIRSMKERGVTASVVHQRIDHNTIFGGIDPTLEMQKKFDSTQIHIPMHDQLSENDVNTVIAAIKQGW